MPSRTSGNPNTRGSARLPVGEQNLQLASYQVPILAPGMPMLHNPLGRQVQHPPQGIITRKAGLVLRDLPELPVQSLDDIRRVYDFPNLRRVFKERAQNFPVFFPALDTGRVLLPPGISKLAQIFLRLVQGDGSIDLSL